MNAAHPVYQHRDGSKCIWLDRDGWFVPLDVGGEGYPCEHPEHEAQRAAALASVRMKAQPIREYLDALDGFCGDVIDLDVIDVADESADGASLRLSDLLAVLDAAEGGES